MITEQQTIRPSHPKYKIIDEMCFHSKDLYNYANYLIRQSFIINKEYIPYQKMNCGLHLENPDAAIDSLKNYINYV